MTKEEEFRDLTRVDEPSLIKYHGFKSSYYIYDCWFCGRRLMEQTLELLSEAMFMHWRRHEAEHPEIYEE